MGNRNYQKRYHSPRLKSSRDSELSIRPGLITLLVLSILAFSATTSWGQEEQAEIEIDISEIELSDDSPLDARDALIEVIEASDLADEKASSDGEEKKQAKDPFRAAVQRLKLDKLSDTMTAAEFIRVVARRITDESEILKQVSLLGNPDFAKREMATAKLLVFPFLTKDVEEVAKSSESAEVRWRLQMVIKNQSGRKDSLLLAALESVQNSKPKNLIPELVLLMDSENSDQLSLALNSTYSKLAQKSDRAILEKGLKSELPETRRLNAGIVARLFGNESISLIEPLLNDQDELTRLEVAILMLDLKHRPAINILSDLIDSKRDIIKRRANRVLIASTGEDFGQLPYSDQKEIAAIKSKWVKWVDANGETCKLFLPVSQYLKNISALNGNTLVVVSGKVTEYSPDRKEVLKFDCASADQVDKTFEGTYIVHSYSKRWLKEVDAKGKTIWEIKGESFNNSMPLRNGNVLVTIGNKNLIREYSRETRKVVWEHKLESWTNDAFRMENGNTMVGYHGGVVEVTPDKKIAWRYPKKPGTVTICRPQANGNVIIGWTEGTVREVNREGKTVWEYKCGEGLNDVFRDELGHTLIYSKSKFIELDINKKEIWKVQISSGNGTIRR